MPYAPTTSSARSNGNVQPSDCPDRTLCLSTSKIWKHCQNRKSPIKTSPSLKFKTPLRASAQAAPVKNKIAVSVSNSESRLSSCVFDAALGFFLSDRFTLTFTFLRAGFFLGKTRIPQRIAGRPSTSVMFVTLLTSELVITSAPLPPLRPRMKAKMRLPSPVQYGMTSVPSTVPSKPFALKISSRQIIRNDDATNNERNSHGA